MDNIDEMIFLSLKEIKCNIPNAESVSDLTVSDVINVVASCLNRIKPELQLPTTLPSSMSSRYKICAKLAECCSDIGYKGNIGYQSFLYSNETEIRKILVFLIENMTMEASSSENRFVYENDINREICQQLSQTLSENSSQYVCKTSFISSKLESGILLPGQRLNCKPNEWKEYVGKKLPFICEQEENCDKILPSLISLNSRGIYCPTPRKEISTRQFNSVPRSSIESNNEIKENETCSEISSSVGKSHKAFERDSFTVIKGESQDISENGTDKLKQDVTSLKENIRLYEEELQRKMEQVTRCAKNKEALNSNLENAVSLLENSEANIAKLVEMNEKLKNKMNEKREVMDLHQSSLLDTLNELKSKAELEMVEENDYTEKLSSKRDELRSLMQDIYTKRNIKKNMVADLEKNRGISRAEHTTRILEIVRNIKKQVKDIEKILSDTKVLQKELNQLIGKNDRQGVAVDELITESVKKCVFPKDMCKYVTSLRKDCESIDTLVTDIGMAKRSIISLEEQVIIENNSLKVETFEQVFEDLNRIREEKIQLLQKMENAELIDSQ